MMERKKWDGSRLSALKHDEKSMILCHRFDKFKSADVPTEKLPEFVEAINAYLGANFDEHLYSGIKLLGSKYHSSNENNVELWNWKDLSNRLLIWINELLALDTKTIIDKLEMYTKDIPVGREEIIIKYITFMLKRNLFDPMINNQGEASAKDHLSKS